MDSLHGVSVDAHVQYPPFALAFVLYDHRKVAFLAYGRM